MTHLNFGMKFYYVHREVIEARIATYPVGAVRELFTRILFIH